MSGPVTRSALRRAIADLNHLLVPSFDAAASPEALRRVLAAARASFRRLVKIHHPDQGGTSREFIRLTRARDVVNLATDEFLPSLLPRNPGIASRRFNLSSLSITLNGVPVRFDGASIQFSD